MPEKIMSQMSPIPFEGVIEEIVKLQGDKPAMLILWSGPEDLTFLKHNFTFDGEIMDLFVKHMILEFMNAKRIAAEKEAEKNKKDLLGGGIANAELSN